MAACLANFPTAPGISACPGSTHRWHCRQACEQHLARLLTTASGVDWQEWLLLADRLELPRLVGLCSQQVVRALLSRSAFETAARPQALTALSLLSKRSYQLMMETCLRVAVDTEGRTAPAQRVPSTASWSAPGDLFR